jgi:hypothetical protein
VFITQKERDNAEFAVELQRESKIITPGKSFELLNQTEIEALIGNEMLYFKQYDSVKHKNIRIFKSRIVNEIKGKTTDFPYEKSRLIIQSYSDEGKVIILTQSPIIQRFSQRVILSQAVGLYSGIRRCLQPIETHKDPSKLLEYTQLFSSVSSWTI